MGFQVDREDEILFWSEDYKRNHTIHARIYHRKTERHYSGSGASVWEAIAWCLDDLVRRAFLGHEPTLAINADAHPGSFA